MKSLVVAIPTIAIIVAGSSIAFAEDRAKGPKKKPEITQAEYMAKQAERFTKMDMNGDGVLSMEERRAAQEVQKERMKEFKNNMKDRRKRLSDN